MKNQSLIKGAIILGLLIARLLFMIGALLLPKSILKNKKIIYEIIKS